MSQAALLTTAEVGAILGKSTRTIVRMAVAGDLPVAQRLPGPKGDYLFSRVDILRLAAELQAEKESA